MAAAAAAAKGKPPAAGCDRRCLVQHMYVFTEALTDNTPGKVALAATAKATYNGVAGKLGASEVWGPSRRLPYRQVFVDPVTGAAVFYGIVTTAVPRPAAGQTAAAPPRWWFYVARLKLAGGKVTEVEEIGYERPPNGFGADPSTLTKPDRIWDAIVPVGERSTRAQLFDLADKYFDAVSQRIHYDKVPWHPECQRIELGVYTVNAPTTNGSCGGEFQVPSVKWNVENRRFYIADVERGVVIAAGNFMTPPEFPRNNGSVVMEVFKVQDGMIRHIEAFFRGNGQLHSGWGSGPGS
jgi:hypothetical protein